MPLDHLLLGIRLKFITTLLRQQISKKFFSPTIQSVAIKHPSHIMLRFNHK